MADKTKIAWTDATWNAIYGCSRVSKGCERCYAEQVVASLPRKFKERNPEAFTFFSGLTKETSQGPRWTGVVKVHEGHLLQPLKWTEPRRIFVNSLSDLFHENLPFEDIARVFAVMALAPWHTFQVLTKRPQRALDFLAWLKQKRRGYLHGYVGCLVDSLHGFAGGEKNQETPPQLQAYFLKKQQFEGRDQATSIGDATAHHWPLPNVWLGVSVEDQRAADERIPLLLQTPAKVRFLSCEPLLGPVNIRTALFPPCGGDVRSDHLCSLCHSFRPIDWVIVGGESGPNFRPMQMEWARSIADQCEAAKVPFFFKQDSDRRAGQRPYLVRANGRAYRYHQFPGQLTAPEFVETP